MAKSKVKPRLMRSCEAAPYLHISTRHLAELTKQGRIPVHKFGPRLNLYALADLDAFIDSTRVRGTNAA